MKPGKHDVARKRQEAERRSEHARREEERAEYKTRRAEYRAAARGKRQAEQTERRAKLEETREARRKARETTRNMRESERLEHGRKRKEDGDSLGKAISLTVKEAHHSLLKVSNSNKKAREKEKEAPIGKGLSFAAAEAYRLLRTNLLFSLPEGNRCRVIGITSAGPGEGKTTTSLNLAYMIAESEKQVLLIEGDMRLPTVAKRLNLQPSPGLSNLLAGLSSGKKVMQPSGIENNLRIITSGDIPPNPSELLGSEGMRTAIEVLSQNMDYIIVDLPPINEVADALVASRLVDGLVMVVRQSYASRRAVADAMAQLKHADAKVLGFVLTRSDTLKKGKYKKYGKYGKYKYYKHYYGYRESVLEEQQEDAGPKENAPEIGK